MKRKNLLALFLCLVMLLSLFPVSAFAEETETLPAEEETAAPALPEELTPADPDEKPVLPGEKVEVEEGVFHGCRRSGDLPQGVYNTDYPELVEFQLVEAGQTLAVGDTVHIRAKFTDNDGIASVSCYIGSSYSNYWAAGHYLSMTRVEGTDWFEGVWTFTEEDGPGDYFVPSLEAADPSGFYTCYQSSSKRVMQRLLPGIVTLAGEERPNQDAEGPQDFTLAEAGQTLSPGDVLHISFTLRPGLQSVSFRMDFYGKHSFSVDPDLFRYDAETGVVTAEYQLTADLINGVYYVSYLYFWGCDDGGSYERDWFFTYGPTGYSFTLTGATEQPASPISISQISCDKDGQTVTDGDTVTVRFRVNSDLPASYAHVSFQYFTAASWGNTGAYTGTYSRSFSAVLNEETGLYEASYTFGEDDAYGVYTISNIGAGNGQASTYRNDPGIMFLFAEDPGATFTRLAPATNLNWTKDGRARFTVPTDFSGFLNIRYYNTQDEDVGGINWILDGKTASWTRDEGIHNFLNTDLPSGDYYFTVTLRGDGVDYYDSVTARSGLFSYTKPETRLGTATELSWETIGGGESKQARFKMPAETANLGDVSVRLYFSERADKRPEFTGWSCLASAPDAQGWAYAQIPEELLRSYGNGYYYYTVTLYRANLKTRNGEESAMSPAYNITGLAESVQTQLESIETEGKTPEEIRQQIAAIPTEDLTNAMLTDDSVAELLEELETAVGARTLVVSQNVPELSEGVRAVGAGLNETVADGDVTLVIDRAENDPAIPGWCDEALSVTFSMNLENVADPEHLTVPVLVDIPIPADFDPDRLVILHYHAAGGEPEVIYPYIYLVRNQYYAQFTLLSFSDFALAQVLGPQPQFEPTSYLLLTEGESAELSLFEDQDYLDLSWTVTDENGQPFVSEEDAVISVDENGTVTALRPGTAYVLAAYSIETWLNTTTENARCRIDVIAAADEEGGELAQPVAAAVRQVTLLDSKATVELYKTEYATVSILPEMERLLSTAAANSVVSDEAFPPPADKGAAVASARFTGAGSELFDAVVLDDRTIAVVPKESTLHLAQQKASNVKGSYSFGLELTMADGSVFTAQSAKGDAVLKLTVKKSLPKIKAKAVALNSYFYDCKPIVFTGGTVLGAWESTEKAPPAWMYLEEETQSVQYCGDLGAKSGKGTLTLEVLAEGWRVTQEVKVSVSYKSTAPTITFKNKTLTLKPGTSDKASTYIFVKPAKYPVDLVTVSRITEGKGKTLKTYENGTVLDVQVEYAEDNVYSKDNGSVTVSAPYVDDAAHTYTVYLSIHGKESSFTVKTLAVKSAVSLKLSLAGSAKVMDLAIAKCPVNIVASMGNFHVDAASLAVKTIVNKAAPDVDVRSQFRDKTVGNVLILTASDDEPVPGTYIATVSADYGGGSVEKTISFTVKRSAKVPAPSLKLSVKGSLDVLRPQYGIFIIPNVRNYYDYKLTDMRPTITKTYDGAIKKKVSEDVTSCFKIYYLRDMFMVELLPGSGLSHTDKYTVQITLNDISSKPVALKVTQSKPKVQQSTKTVTLLKNDRMSQGEVVLSLSDLYLTGIREVKLVSPTDKAKVPYFDLLDLGGGRYAIAFHDNRVSVTKNQTVKLQVFFHGNTTATPNVTLNLKVEIR